MYGSWNLADLKANWISEHTVRNCCCISEVYFATRFTVTGYLLGKKKKKITEYFSSIYKKMLTYLLLWSDFISYWKADFIKQH